jgi:imidazolonepropionase-like amidohydrolase
MRRFLFVPCLLTLVACSSDAAAPSSGDPDATLDSSIGDAADGTPADEGADTADVDPGDTSAATDSSLDTTTDETADAGGADATEVSLDATDDSSSDTTDDGGIDGADVASDAASDLGETNSSDASVTCAPTPPPAVTTVGTTAGTYLLKGTIVTPDTYFVGEVLVVGDTLSCVAASCSALPAAAGATVVDTQGIIFPGLIDTHNHILFDIFDETDWSPTKTYTNHNQWPGEARYSAMVDTKQYLNGEGASTWDFGCEMDKFGELKGLVAGTTSIAGSANPANRACYGSLARTIDQSPNDLGIDNVQAATLFPTKASADGVCANFTSAKTTAYLIHIAEGTDATALGEFAKLGNLTSTPNCLFAPQTTIVHGTALGDPELTTMAANGMKLTWSPRSNVYLYGGGSDLTKTSNVPLALTKGINVALAPDWSMGGSQNLLDELRFADKVDNTVWGDKLTPKMLVQMVTTHAAKNLALDAKIGSLAAGKKADLFVIGGDASAPYDALLASTPRDVRLVMVGGVALYGDVALSSIAPKAPGCETIDICCATKFVCVAEAGGTTTNKFGQTYADITTALSTALTNYDAMGLTAWKFAPLTPLVRCP